ncbi:hypothetical protein [Ahrensia sp. R2A130]|uniref:hypothetical protein n=1 Tax=Ahrensia sp. R2A130 TaxID=744979 RepID=UPI0001E0B4F4|nr:hypothetical protein [Ahrensia sp. R2A130]EFL88258.1 conserved hypothetical protein [Ahrensia sp. R2A130]
MAYADTTKVPVAQTKTDIEKIVNKYGATSFGVLTSANSAQVAFEMGGRNILFRVDVPEKVQAERSRWRALLLVIKAKLESVEAGIETFENAFLANVMMPDGRTVGEHTGPMIEQHYSGDASVPLLPHIH